MKPVEILKIFGYIFLLMFLLLLLKGLSTFEFAIRDKTVQYEEVFTEEFLPQKGIRDLLRGGKKVPDEYTLELGLFQNLKATSVLPKLTYDSTDTVYMELRVRTNLHPDYSGVLALEAKEGELINIKTLTGQHAYQILKTPEFAFNDLGNLIILHELQVMRTLEVDSSIDLGDVTLDYIKVFKKHTPEQLF